MPENWERLMSIDAKIEKFFIWFKYIEKELKEIKELLKEREGK